MRLHADDVSVPPAPPVLSSDGGPAVVGDALFERLYGELRRLARARLASLRGGETLNTTGLVHEAYLRLIAPERVAPVDRAHFLALAARAMRYVVLDHARARARLKRGGPHAALPLDPDQVAADERAADVLALDDALVRLRARAPRLAETVEYRFYAGLGYAEIAEATGRSVATVERDWVRARAWLYRDLRDAGATSALREGTRDATAMDG